MPFFPISVQYRKMIVPIRGSRSLLAEAQARFGFPRRDTPTQAPFSHFSQQLSSIPPRHFFPHFVHHTTVLRFSGLSLVHSFSFCHSNLIIAISLLYNLLSGSIACPPQSQSSSSAAVSSDSQQPTHSAPDPLSKTAQSQSSTAPPSPPQTAPQSTPRA